MMAGYNVARYNTGAPHVVASEFGNPEYSRHRDAARFVARWNLANARLEAQNPPSLWHAARDQILNEIAGDRGSVPGGNDILGRILAAERR